MWKKSSLFWPIYKSFQFLIYHSKGPCKVLSSLCVCYLFTFQTLFLKLLCKLNQIWQILMFSYVITCNWKVILDHEVIFCSEVVRNERLIACKRFYLKKLIWSNCSHFDNILFVFFVSDHMSSEGGLDHKLIYCRASVCYYIFLVWKSQDGWSVAESILVT